MMIVAVGSPRNRPLTSPGEGGLDTHVTALAGPKPRWQVTGMRSLPS